MSIFRHARSISAIVKVKPAPDSIAYSSAVLRRLQDFGEVTTFREKQRHGVSQPDESSYTIAFTEPAHLRSALQASPLEVKVDEDLPDPKILDPFNLFGLQRRKQWQPKTYICEVVQDQVQLIKLEEEDVHYRVVVDERTGGLYESLIEAEVPAGMLEGLASTVTVAEESERSRTRLQPSTMHTVNKIDHDPIPPKLMDMYHDALRRKARLEQGETLREEQAPFVAKYIPTHMKSRKGGASKQNGEEELRQMIEARKSSRTTQMFRLSRTC